MKKRVLAWGKGYLGGTASGSYAHVASPAVVRALEGAEVREVSGSWASAVAVLGQRDPETGAQCVRWGWKDNLRSQLAVGRAMRFFPAMLHLAQTSPAAAMLGRAAFRSAGTVPTAVAEDGPAGELVAAGAGAEFGALVDAEGRLFTFGVGVHGQLGRGRGWRNEFSEPGRAQRVRGPIEGRRVVGAACGFQHLVAVDERGEVWACGKGSAGALGVWRTRLEPRRQDLREFEMVNVREANAADGQEGEDGPMPPVARVACGFQHSVMLGRDGSVWAAGKGGGGQMGNDAFEDRAVPHRVRLPEPATDIAAGPHHTLALGRDTGAVYSWGVSRHGECGRPPAEATPNPYAKHEHLALSAVTMLPGPVRGLEGVRAARLVAGFKRSAVLTEDGRLVAWGRGGEADDEDADPDAEHVPRDLGLPGRVTSAAFLWRSAVAVVEVKK